MYQLEMKFILLDKERKPVELHKTFGNICFNEVIEIIKRVDYQPIEIKIKLKPKEYEG